MTICKVCGKENKADYTFCLGCGAELKAAGAAAPAPRPASSPLGGMAGLGPPGASTEPSGPPVGMDGLPLGGPPTPAPLAGMRAATPPLGAQAAQGPFSPNAPFTPASGPFAPGGSPFAPSGPSPFAAPAAGSSFAPAPAPSAPLGGGQRSVSAGWSIGDAGSGLSGYKPPLPPDPDAGPTKVGGGLRPVAPAPVPVVKQTAGAMGAAVRPSAPLAPAPVATPLGGDRGSGPVESLPAGTRGCPNCGANVPAEFAFCGSCGSRVAPAPSAAPPPAIAPIPSAIAPVAAPLAPPAPAVSKARGKIVLIRPDGSEGASLSLSDGENVIGRAMGPLFENDGYLSPRHAEIVINAAGCVVRDLKSLNGVYFKMTHEEALESADIFRIGQELLRFDLVPAASPLDDGTEIMGSPNLGYWGRISLVIGRDIDGNAWPVGGDGVTLGRERGDINFPDDGYVSGLHARIAFAGGRVTLTDLHSSNGTFMRVRSERVLENGALVQFGQQLFRLQLA